MSKKAVIPKHLFVYICDYLDGAPVYAVALKVDDCDNGPVGSYELLDQGTKVTNHRIEWKDGK